MYITDKLATVLLWHHTTGHGIRSICLA